MRASPFAFFLAVAALVSCGDPSAQFDIHYASDYPRAPLHLSVFGVYKDGRLSAESWDLLAKPLSSPFSSGTCEVVYSDALLAHAPDTATALDDFARANGVTDDLLDVYAPKAQGDAILLITVAGHPPEKVPDNASGASASSPAMSPTRGRGPGRMGMGMGGAGTPAMGPRNTDQNVFLMSASLYSVSLHHSIAEVGMTYSGKSVDDAVKSFHDKLASELKGASCVGWKPDVAIDADKIHGIAP